VHVTEAQALMKREKITDAATPLAQAIEDVRDA